jgi:hypothetical protein
MNSAAVIETTGTSDDVPPKELVLRKENPDEEGLGVIEAMPSNAEDIVVFARTQGEMALAQDALIDWCQRKVAYLEKERRSAEENRDAAAAAKVATAPWKRLVGLAKRRVLYYRKILAALEEGYCIVPDFPINVIAVRTKKTRPTDRGNRHDWASSVKSEKPQLLPVGEGEYVNPDPSHYIERETVDKKDHKGEITKVKETKYVTCDDFDEIDFPLRIVRPQVLNAYQKAMEKKLFDSIGVLPNNRRTPDPMIVGRIELREGTSSKQLSFLIGWWIPTRSL